MSALLYRVTIMPPLLGVVVNFLGMPAELIIRAKRLNSIIIISQEK
jgi:hypothetical protein